MSEPRLTETRKSSGDLMPLEPAALRQLALAVLTRHSGSEADADVLATAARRAYEDLAHVSSSLIGQIGVDALITRAVHLAQREYPWLPAAPEPDSTNEPFARVIASLSQQPPAHAIAATAAVFATFAGLLVTFIGEPLTTGLLRKAWPDAFSDAQTKES